MRRARGWEMHWDAQRQKQKPQDRRRNWAGLVWFQTTNHGENIPCLKCTITITGRRRNCSKQMLPSWTSWLETRWRWWQSWKWSRGGWWARVCMEKTRLPHFWCITKRIERKQKQFWNLWRNCNTLGACKLVILQISWIRITPTYGQVTLPAESIEL